MKKNQRKLYQKKRRKLISNLLIFFIFLVGLVIMCYPFYISALNDYLDQIRISNYQKETHEKFEKQELANQNQQLTEQGIAVATDPFEATSVSEVSEAYYNAHLLGSITIPKIKVDIPLFDTTNAELLELGATVVQGTSLPLGMENSHSVISAHCGLPNRTLFTQLSKLEIGDTFILEVLGEKMAYQVEQIKTVEPDETDELAIETGRDLVTLLTCTPYMINSHRLLVTGFRITYTEELAKEVEQVKKSQSIYQLALLVGAVIALLLAVMVVYRLMHHYLLSKEIGTLSFKITSQTGEPFQEKLWLYHKKGKKALKRQGENLVFLPDKSGNYQLSQLPKNIYCLKTESSSLVFLIGQQKVKKKQIELKILKNKIDGMIVLNNEFIQL